MLFGFSLIPYGVAQETLDTNLVLRLFGSLYGQMLSREDISVGELPPTLARAFPLPPRTQPAVGVTYNRFSSTAVLDSQLTPARVLAFYRRVFTEQGYRPLPSDTPPSVFVSAPTEAGVTACKDGRVAAVTARRSGGVTDVRLDRYSGRPGDSCEVYSGLEAEGAPLTLVPPLLNPDGARALGGGQSGGGAGMFTAEQQLETDLTPRELLRHYGEQLGAGGWEAVPLPEDAPLKAFTLSRDGERYTLILSVRSDGDGLATVFVGGA